MPRLLLVLALAFVACCHNSGKSPPSSVPAPPTPAPNPITCGDEVRDPKLRATLTLTRTDYAAVEDVELDVAIENVSDGPVEVDPIELVSQPLLLEVRSGAGAVMPPVPPSVPSGQTRLILPREKLHRTLNLGTTPELPPGEYHVCARRWMSNTVTLRIGSRGER